MHKKMKKIEVLGLATSLALAAGAHAAEWVDENRDGTPDYYLLDVYVVTAANESGYVQLPTVTVDGNTCSNFDWNNFYNTINNGPVVVEDSVTGDNIGAMTPSGISINTQTFNSESTIKAITYNRATLQTHTSGWQPISMANDPASFIAFSLTKSAVFWTATASTTGFLQGLGASFSQEAITLLNGVGGAAALNLTSDMVGFEFKVDGRSVEGSPWYGTVDTRLTWTGIQQVLDFQGTGNPERYLIEGSVTYRVTFADGSVYEFSPTPLPNSTTADEYLDDQEAKGFNPRDEVRGP